MRDEDGIYIIPDDLDCKVIMVLTKAVRHENEIELVGKVRSGDATPELPAKAFFAAKDMPKFAKDWPERWANGGISIPIRIEVKDGKRSITVI